MKIAVTSTGPDLESEMDQRFGRAPYFLIVDSETLDFDIVDESQDKPSGGAGIAAAQNLLDRGAEAVITGHLGPNAYSVLQAADLDLYQGITGSVRDNIKEWKNSGLDKISTAGPSHFGQRGGRP